MMDDVGGDGNGVGGREKEKRYMIIATVIAEMTYPIA